MFRLGLEGIRQAVKKDLISASLALGATKSQTNYKIVIGGAKSGIFAALILGIGRAMGEATAVSMVCGGATGIAISLFSSTAIDRANYTLLMQEIYETLKAKDPTYLLTAAIPGGPYLTSRFDLANVHKYLDFINIMTYDLQSSGRATHHTALYPSSATISGCSVDESVKSYLNQGVPAEKIVIGIAFYGKYTVSSSLGGSGSSYKSITYTKILSDYLNNPNASYYNGFDEIANAPYILDYTNGYFITYDNELSVERKCQYVLNNKLGGVMVWEIGEDMSGNLVSVINKTMKMEK